MKFYSFVKRLNATELGVGVTNDTYIAIPKEVDLSSMLVNQQAMNLYDRQTGKSFTPDDSNIKYVQTGQNGQERISGLGQYFTISDAKVGDEILIEKISDGAATQYVLDFHHRNAIVFQKARQGVEILTEELIKPYESGNDYILNILYEGKKRQMEVKFLIDAKKKKTSPRTTKFYDLIVDGYSILSNYGYQEYIEIITDGMRLGRMKTYIYSIIEMMEDKDE